MSFQVGDRVVVNSPAWKFDGETGTVLNVSPQPGGYDCVTVKTDRACGAVNDLLHLTSIEIEPAPIVIPAAGQPVTVNKAIIGAAPHVATITTAQQFQQVTGMAPPPGMFGPYTGQIFSVPVQSGDATETPINVTPACSWCDEQHVSPKCERYAKLYAERLEACGIHDTPEAKRELERWSDARDEDERTRKRRGLP